MNNSMNEPDSTDATPEVPSRELLDACYKKVATYAFMTGSDTSGAFFDLPNGNSVYVTSKPANMTLKPGEICIGLYNKEGRIRNTVVVTSPEQALTEVEQWGQ